MCLFWLLACGCSLFEKKAERTDLFEASHQAAALEPEKNRELLAEAGSNWLYGQGIGNTMLQVGATVLFPPYAAVLVGNAALELSGYDSLGVSSFLPAGSREAWLEGYHAVTAVPGRLNSQVAGEEFRDPAEAQARIARILNYSADLEYLTLSE